MKFLSKETATIHLRKRYDIAARAGEGITIESFIDKESIGSCYRNGAILRGVSFEEERLLLPPILGVSPTNEDAFVAASKLYWVNIERKVPPPDINGRGGGLNLEIGFKYETEDAQRKGDSVREAQHKKFFEVIEDQISGKPENIIIDKDVRVMEKLGQPINPEDYLLWRYALMYPNIAKDVRLVDNSTKIRFYMISEQTTARINENNSKVVKAATLAWLDLTKDTEKLRRIITVMDTYIVRMRQVDGKEYPIEKVTEQEFLTKILAERYPEQFTAACEDKDLQAKSFIFNCINRGILRRIANTNSIYYDNIFIGKDINDAILYLRDEQNKGIKQEIDAKYSLK